MIVVRFRNKEEHEDLTKQVKKMKKFIDELEYMLEECCEESDEYSLRGGRYRKEYEEEDMKENPHSFRYGYRRGGMR